MQTKKQDEAEIILSISIGFLLIFIVFKVQWAALLSLIIGLLGLFSPLLRLKICILWLKLSRILSYIIPNVIIGLFFILVFSPYSILMRLFYLRKDNLKLKNNYESTFIFYERTFDKDFFEKMG